MASSQPSHKLAATGDAEHGRSDRFCRPVAGDSTSSRSRPEIGGGKMLTIRIAHLLARRCPTGSALCSGKRSGDD
ncbi:hypothetical protein WOLCODRAFT_141071 [Wolfiporia cocos MD-104 SS10]|uniref:Uncharacterized protein n=1 Tax=Wolfiporia cocos (strain MD-104) TaxID=742152 RepID=A0A2H3JAU4_WOLCO|nr:hypothetical protein WOLCODRAFT_141071 [Wolfiporia cocos MD-104 SS10]